MFSGARLQVQWSPEEDACHTGLCEEAWTDRGLGHWGFRWTLQDHQGSYRDWWLGLELAGWVMKTDWLTDWPTDWRLGQWSNYKYRYIYILGAIYAWISTVSMISVKHYLGYWSISFIVTCVWSILLLAGVSDSHCNKCTFKLKSKLWRHYSNIVNGILGCWLILSF